MANVNYVNGKYYVVNDPGLEQFGVNWGSQKLLDAYIKGGKITQLSGIGTVNQAETPAKPQPFTPNAITQAQLQGASNGMAPQWMMDAYTKKIGQMGGNANPALPFTVTQSGFPGVGGKTAPANSTGTGG
jgi:hypothetical protein